MTETEETEETEDEELEEENYCDNPSCLKKGCNGNHTDSEYAEASAEDQILEAELERWRESRESK